MLNIIWPVTSVSHSTLKSQPPQHRNIEFPYPGLQLIKWKYGYGTIWFLRHCTKFHINAYELNMSMLPCYCTLLYTCPIPSNNYTFNWGGPPCTVTRWVHFAALESKSLRRGISCPPWSFCFSKDDCKVAKGMRCRNKQLSLYVYDAYFEWAHVSKYVSTCLLEATASHWRHWFATTPGLPTGLLCPQLRTRCVT